MSNLPVEKKGSPPPYMEGLGKVPPQAVESEEYVLACMLLNPNAVYKVYDLIDKDVFYTEQHKTIYQAIDHCVQNDIEIDLLTVSEALKKQGNLEIAGGNYYLTELSGKAGSDQHLERHCYIIYEKYMLRTLIRSGDTLIKGGYDESTDPFSLQQDTVKSLLKLDEIGRITDESAAALYEKLVNSYDKEGNEGRGSLDVIVDPIPTGYVIDRDIGGIVPGELTIIGGRPGEGKTSLMLKILYNMAKAGVPVAAFSLEMKNMSLFVRLVCMLGRIDGEKVRKNELSKEEMTRFLEVAKQLGALPIYFKNAAGETGEQIRVKIKRMKLLYDIKVVGIDYLQLIQGKGFNKEEDVSRNSTLLKQTATKEEVGIIALAQLNRAVEKKKKGERYDLGDLRNSGQIEQDADMVMFVYRPEIHKIKEDAEGNSTEGVAYWDVRKHRNGSLCEHEMEFEAKYTLYKDIGDVEGIDEPDEMTADDDLPF